MIDFTTRTSSDGVCQRDFTIGDVPGVLWSPEPDPGPTPLVLIGHGGGLHKKAPPQVARARHLVSRGFRVVAIDAPGHGDRPRSAQDEQARAELRDAMAEGNPIDEISSRYGLAVAERAVPEWQRTIDELQRLPGIGSGTPIGYGGGVTLGTAIGIRLAAVEPRITAAIFGNGFVVREWLLAAARAIVIPVLFLLQWDDELVERAPALELFDAFASTAKTMHANLGGHGRVPPFEHDASAEFLRQHLTESAEAAPPDDEHRSHDSGHTRGAHGGRSSGEPHRRQP